MVMFSYKPMYSGWLKIAGYHSHSWQNHVVRHPLTGKEVEVMVVHGLRGLGDGRLDMNV